jgi:hypothetical protein
VGGGCEVAVRWREVVVVGRFVVVALSLLLLRVSKCGPVGVDVVAGGVDAERDCRLRSGSRSGCWLWKRKAFATSVSFVVM